MAQVKKSAASKADQIPRMAHKKKTMNLKTELSQEELTAAAEELAESTQNVNRLEDQKKAATAQFKSDIDYASARRNKFAGIVATKCEYRNVDCDMLYDYEEKMVTITRLDTGEEVTKRAMFEDELQQPLPLEK